MQSVLNETIAESRMWPFTRRKPGKRISQVIVEFCDAISSGGVTLTDDNKTVLRLIRRYPRFVRLRRLNVWEQRMAELIERKDAEHSDMAGLLEAIADFGTSGIYTVFSVKEATELYDIVSEILDERGLRHHVEYTITSY